MFESEGARGRSRRDTELDVDVLQVTSRSVLTDDELRGDPTVALADATSLRTSSSRSVMSRLPSADVATSSRDPPWRGRSPRPEQRT